MERNVNGTQCDINTDDIYLYMEVLVLLYADDTVLFSDKKKTYENHLMILAIAVLSGNWKLIQRKQIVEGNTKMKLYLICRMKQLKL